MSCARSQAQGLIIRMDPKNTTLDFGTNAYFPCYLWRPILRMVHSGSRFLRYLKVHNLVLSGVSVYPACTSVGRIRCF